MVPYRVICLGFWFVRVFFVVCLSFFHRPSLAYYPERSVVSLLRKQYRRTAIPTNSDKFDFSATFMLIRLVQSCDNCLQLESDISNAILHNYKVPLAQASFQTINDSIAYERGFTASLCEHRQILLWKPSNQASYHRAALRSQSGNVAVELSHDFSPKESV